MDLNLALDALTRSRELLTGARLELSMRVSSIYKSLADARTRDEESLNELQDELTASADTMKGTISLLNQTARQTFAASDALQTDEGPEYSSVPNDFQMERETIAALCYAERDSADKAFRFLTTEDFFYATHRLMLGSLRKAHEKGVLYQSPALLATWLVQDGTAEKMATAQGEPSLSASEWAAIYDHYCLKNSLTVYCPRLRAVTLKRQAWLALAESWRDLNLHTADAEWLGRLRQRMSKVAKQIDHPLGKVSVNGKAKVRTP